MKTLVQVDGLIFFDPEAIKAIGKEPGDENKTRVYLHGDSGHWTFNQPIDKVLVALGRHVKVDWALREAYGEPSE